MDDVPALPVVPSSHPAHAFKHAVVIANPVAGRGRGEPSALAIAAGLKGRGVSVDVHLTRARGEGAELAARRRPGTDLLVSVGGDGTLREVLEGVAGDAVPVAVFPLGTANVLALDLRLPRDVEGTLRMIAGGKTTLLDVATVNGRLSFLVTGVGIDAAMVHAVESKRRGPISKMTYVSAGLRAMRRYRAPKLSVEIDGVVVERPTGALLISNIIHYGGVFRLSSDRRLDDGLFEVYLCSDGRRFAMARLALRALIRGLPGGTSRMVRARRVRVTADGPVPYQVDGDFGGEIPLDFEVSPVQRRILVP